MTSLIPQDDDLRPEIEQLRHRAALRVLEGEYPKKFSQDDMMEALQTINKMVEQNRIKDDTIHAELEDYIEETNKKMDSDMYKDAVEVNLEISRNQRRPNCNLPDFLEKYFDNTIAEEQFPIMILEKEEKDDVELALGPTPYDASKKTIDKLDCYINQRENFQNVQKERLVKEIQQIIEELEETKKMAREMWKEKLQLLFKGHKSNVSPPSMLKRVKSTSSSRKSTKSSSSTSLALTTNTVWEQWTTSSKIKSIAAVTLEPASTAAPSTASTPSIAGNATPISDKDDAAITTRSESNVSLVPSNSSMGTPPVKQKLRCKAPSGEGTVITTAATTPVSSTPLSSTVTGTIRDDDDDTIDDEEDLESLQKTGDQIFALTTEQEDMVEVLLTKFTDTESKLAISEVFQPAQKQLQRLEEIDMKLAEITQGMRPISARTTTSFAPSVRSRASTIAESVVRAEHDERELEFRLLALDRELIKLKDRQYPEEEIERILNEAGTYKLSSNFLRDNDKSLEKVIAAKERLPDLLLPENEMKELRENFDNIEKEVTQLEEQAKFEIPKPKLTANELDVLGESIQELEREMDAQYEKNAAKLKELELGGAEEKEITPALTDIPEQTDAARVVAEELLVMNFDEIGEKEGKKGDDDINNDPYELPEENELLHLVLPPGDAYDDIEKWNDDKLSAAVELLKVGDMQEPVPLEELNLLVERVLAEVDV